MIRQWQQGLFPSQPQAFGNHMLGAVEQRPDVLELLDFLTLIPAVKATPAQTHPIEASHPSWVALNEAVGRHIPVHPGHATDHRHAPDVHELVDPKASSDHSLVFDQHMTGDLDAVGHHDAVAQQTVVSQMAVGHEQVVVTDPGLLTLIGGPVDGHTFADGVVISDHHLRRGALVLEILWLETEAGTGENLVVLADDQSTIQHRMGADPGLGTNADVRPHNGAGTDHDTCSKLGTRIDRRKRVDLGRTVLCSHGGGTLFTHHGQSTSENMSSPEQTS